MAGVRSMRLTLSGATVPTAGHPNFTSGEDELELGIGIHGEPRRSLVKMAGADALVKPVADDLNLKRSDEVRVLINTLPHTFQPIAFSTIPINKRPLPTRKVLFTL